jgi:5'-nucleotidase
MRILIGNDDGVDAPGLHALAAAARVLADDVWIVAPERKWTAASHRVTFDCDLVLTARDARTYACSGTPVDAVIAALTVLEGGLKPDLVLAGINDKRNVGEDIAYSGTLAIAREATFFGVPSITLSRDAWPDAAAGDAAEVAALLRLLWRERAQWAQGGVWLSVNLPRDLPAPIRQASLASDKIAAATDIVGLDADRIVYRLRRGRPGTARDGDENAALESGAIVLVRHAWAALIPLPATLVSRWSSEFASR